MNTTDPIEKLRGVNSKITKALEKLGIRTIHDLLFHLPRRYDDFSLVTKIRDVKIGGTYTISGVVLNIQNIRAFRARMTITEVMISDGNNTIKAVWYNQPFLTHNIQQGQEINIAGKVVFQKKSLLMQNPAYEIVNQNSETRHTGRLVPVYRETRGITSRWLRLLVQNAMPTMEQEDDIIPEEIRKKRNLLKISEALKKIHFPSNRNEKERAQKRLSYEELFLIQLMVLDSKKKLREKGAPKIEPKIEFTKEVLETLPFELTDAQKKALWQVMQDMERGYPTNRLVEGDVGSGKTLVALLAAANTAKNGWQSAFMVPTEILAIQHFGEAAKVFKNAGLSIALLTASETKAYEPELKETYSPKKAELIKLINSGNIDIVIGTHSLIQDKVNFKKLGLVIIDEQHRFGVNQRKALMRGTDTEQTQNNAEDDLLHKELTYKIRNVLFNVKKELGCGHKESVYQKAIAEELKTFGLGFSREAQISIKYKNKKVGIYIPDFVIEEKVILELKALSFVGSTEKKQVWNYLKGSDYRLALLANFGPKELTINRIIYDSARNSAFAPQSSASVPHLISMTATPIPRTLAMTLYGDLDISVIDQMPKNRKPIITKCVLGINRKNAYSFIESEVQKGRQVFVICPRIENKTPDDETELSEMQTKNLQQKAVKEEYEKLSKKIFPHLKVAMLHGKMKAKEKEEIMSKFKNKEFDILVSTSVVEVGVDVPNATIMMIEGADRFGLAQLHQFRGRVGRGEYQSYCFLFSDAESKEAQERLKIMEISSDGFSLAEQDLKIRGPGDFIGKNQSGIPDIAMEALINPKLISEAQEDAKEILETDPDLKKHPKILKRISEMTEKVHFE